MPRQPIKERPVTLAEVLEVIREQKKQTKEELGYVQRLTQDYAQKFSKVNLDGTEKLIAELDTVSRKLKPPHISKLIDLMPETLEDIRVLFAKERFTLKDDEARKLLEIIRKYRT